MQTGVEAQQAVLVLDQSTLLSDPAAGSEAVTVNLTLHASEFVLLHIEPLQRASTFADACSGLIAPVQGQVLFLNQNWAHLPFDLANALRGRIGCVFARDTWLSQLSLLDNVVLRQLHHTRRSFAEWREEAVQLATHFGLPGFPAGAPATCRQRTSSALPVSAPSLAVPPSCCWRNPPSGSILSFWFL